ALDLFEGLARDFPAVPGYRRDWATCYECLGDLLHDLRRREEAEEAYKKSLAVREGLTRDFPAVPEHRQHLARSHSSLGRLLNGMSRQEEAEEACRKALTLFEGLARDFPTISEYRQELVQVQVKHSVFLARMGNHAKAVAGANVLAESPGVRASTL